MPVDRIAEIEVLEAEQIEFAFADAIGFFDQSLRGVGPARFEFGGGLFGVVETGEECRFGSGTEVFEQIVSRSVRNASSDGSFTRSDHPRLSLKAATLCAARTRSS